jgi:hypothetical protein
MSLPVADFVRLIQDPAATHIELKGDIVFTHDHFPPENAHDKSKGYNISHKVCLLHIPSAAVRPQCSSLIDPHPAA